MYEKSNVHDEYIGSMTRDSKYGDDGNYARMLRKQLREYHPLEVDAEYVNPKRKSKGKVTIMRGLPGSGKSTYVANACLGAVVVSADNFFMVDGEYQFDRRRIGEAHQHCWNRFIDAIFEGHKHIVVDNTNMTFWEYEAYTNLAGNMGYQIEVLCMKAGLLDDTPLTVLAERNTHGVDLKTIKFMKSRFVPNTSEEYVSTV